MQVTDERRWDGANNICLTISEPNRWLFNKKNQNFDLALLILDARILYEKKCLFYPYNAATKSYRYLSYAELSGAKALEAMFASTISFQKSQQNVQSFTREKNLPSFITTNCQAEVQVTEDIEACYILWIIEHNIPLKYALIEKHLKQITKQSNISNQQRMFNQKNKASHFRLEANSSELFSSKHDWEKSIECPEKDLNMGTRDVKLFKSAKTTAINLLDAIETSSNVARESAKVALAASIKRRDEALAELTQTQKQEVMALFNKKLDTNSSEPFSDLSTSESKKSNYGFIENENLSQCKSNSDYKANYNGCLVLCGVLFFIHFILFLLFFLS